MAPKVFGTPMSACTALVMATLEEVGVAYELVPVNMAVGEHKQPAHTARNPFGQVPAFEDGDLTLFESRAISRYVVRKYKAPGVDLLGESSPEAEALVDVWSEVDSNHFYSAASTIVFQILFMPLFGGAPDQDLVAKNVDKLTYVLDVYEARLSKTKYLAGDSFTLADLFHLPNMFYLQSTPQASLVESRPHVKAWWAALSSRPACKKVTDAMVAAMPK